MAKKKTKDDSIEVIETSSKKDIFSTTLKLVKASEMDETENTYYIDTGSYTLNGLISGSIYGGIPSGCITVLAGEKATGKTYIAIQAAKNFLDAHPTGRVLYTDTEHAVFAHTLAERGVDTSRVYLRRMKTVEQFRFEATSILKGYLETPESQRDPIFLILDSVGMISTEHEMAESEKAPDKSKQDMTKAKMMKGTFRTLTLRLGDANVPLLCTNHVGDKIGGFTRPGMPPPKEMGGGEGLKYAASTIVFLSKSAIYDEIAKTNTGIKLTSKLYKSRFTREGMKGVTMVDFVTGMDRFFGLIDVAKQYGVAKKEGNRYRFPDGQVEYMKNILESPDTYFTEENLKAVDDVIQKAYRYGSCSSDEVPQLVEASDDEAFVPEEYQGEE